MCIQGIATIITPLQQTFSHSQGHLSLRGFCNDYTPLGESDSHVHGHVIEGIFGGIIHSTQGTFHVERAEKFFPGAQKFHSIIYHEGDIITNNVGKDLSGMKNGLMASMHDFLSLAVQESEKRNRHGRLKRQTARAGNSCTVRLAADQLFLENIGCGNIFMAMSEMVAVMSGVQQIFASTDFDGDGAPDSIKPIIAKLEIISSLNVSSSSSDIPIGDFLNLWSQENHSAYCLAYLFTYRDFEDGMLGLSWLGSEIIGGICTQQSVSFSGADLYLNSGIVTFLSFGLTQRHSVATLAVAHELGHSFGAQVRMLLSQSVFV